MPQINITINNIKHLECIDFSYIDGVYIEIDDIDLDIVDSVKSNKKKLYAMMPYVVKENMVDKIIKILKNINEYNIDAICASSLGDISLIKKWTDKKIFCNYMLNPFNRASVDFLIKFGARQITLSPELNITQIKNIAKSAKIELEYIVAGYFPLVISQNCILREFPGKDFCSDECRKKNFYLVDKKRYKFPVVFNKYCQSIIYNSRILFFDKIEDIPANIRIETALLSKNEIKNLILFYWTKINKKKQNIDVRKILLSRTTSGHYPRY